MHINGIGFPNTISWHILFSIGITVKNLKTNNIEEGIKQVQNLYLQRGFKTTHIYSDSEYEPLWTEVADIGISLSYMYNKEHVPDIECFTWTIKEHVQSDRAAMLFMRISKLMVVHLVATAIFWLNDFTPSKPGMGMYNTKGTKQLVLGNIVNDKNCLRLQQGEYVQVH